METPLQKQSQRKKQLWKKVGLWSGGVLILLLAIILICGNLFLSRGLPKTTGEIELAGLSVPFRLSETHLKFLISKRNLEGVTDEQQKLALDILKDWDFIDCHVKSEWYND